MAGDESADVIVLDATRGQSYHYEVNVLNYGGNEFPDLYAVGARYVETMPDNVTQDMVNFINVSVDPLGEGLDEASYKLTTVNGKPVYMLSDFWSQSQDLEVIKSSIHQINSRISSRLASAAEAKRVEFTANLVASVEAVFKEVIGGSLGVSATIKTVSSDERQILLKGPDYLSLAATVKLNSDGVTSKITSIQIIDDGVVIFEIPVENGIPDPEALIGVTFAYSGNSQSSLNDWLAGFNLGMSWNPNKGIVTIRDITDPDVGVVSDE